MWRRVSLILLVLSGCATVPPTPDAKQISRFDIEGEKQLAEGDIKDKIVTTQRPWYSYVAPFIWPPEFFDPLTWQADLRRITRFYEARGYYQARILDDEVLPDGEKFVKLLVRLREGDPARIRSLAIVGLEALPPDMQAAVRQGLPLALDAIFPKTTGPTRRRCSRSGCASWASRRSTSPARPPSTPTSRRST